MRLCPVIALALFACGTEDGDHDSGPADSGVDSNTGTCDGCIREGICHDGNADTACGTGGGACDVCSPLGFTCISDCNGDGYLDDVGYVIETCEAGSCAIAYRECCSTDQSCKSAYGCIWN